MRNYTAVIEQNSDTGLYVGHIPGWPGAHSQGATVDDLLVHVREVVGMLLEEGAPQVDAQLHEFTTSYEANETPLR